jgi:uridine kinase
LSFDKGFFLTIRAIQLLKKHARGEPILVGIAGPSGAGKTVFCQKIADFMPGLCVLSMDMYNDAAMLLDGNFDDPRLTDYDLLMENLRDLKAGQDGGNACVLVQGVQASRDKNDGLPGEQDHHRGRYLRAER